jgi:acetoin utilization deacetylase AcuC-like enzyme
MRAFYADHFVLPLPPGHRFPMQKYAWLRERVRDRLPGVDIQEAPAATDAQLCLAHAPSYVNAVVDGSVSQRIMKDIGFPWSTAMVERSRRSVGASVAALQCALQEGAAVNLAGGTHHAHAAAGSGFCVFNDIAVAVRSVQQAQAENSSRLNVLVIDLDVHQGDGTATITADDDNIFTFSMQGRENYPFARACSDLDVELPTGCGDDAYMDALETALAQVAKRFEPHAVMYVAGVDVHENDRLGRLSLTAQGIERRDQAVLAWCLRRALPVAMCMAGGYGKDLSAMVDIQVDCVGRLLEFQRQWQLLHTPHTSRFF